MQASIENLEGLKRLITVTVPAEDVVKAYGAAFRKAAKNARIDGFRKGHIPTQIIERYYGPNIIGEAYDNLVRETLNKAIEQCGSECAGTPNVSFEKSSFDKAGEFVYTIQFETFPVIEDKPLSEMPLKVVQSRVTDADVDRMIENLRRQQGKWQVVDDAAAEDGRLAKIDFVGRVDGREFDGGKAEDFSLILGRTMMIPGFTEQIAGHKAGDKFTINLYDIKDAADPNNIYGEDGTYSITFELGMMPATLLSVTPADGSQIYTYYPEDGTDGFIVFTFSEPLDESKDGVTVILSWGDKEAGSYEEYHPDFTIEGATVTVDIRGIMIPAEVDSGRGMSGATKVSLSLSGLTTVDGRAVDPNYPSAGTSAILAFFDVKKQEIDFIYDFIPQDGNLSLEGYDEIVIWLSNPIMYDGVTVTWQDVRGGEHSRTYTPEEIPFAWDDYEEGYTAHISLGTISYNTRPVTVNVDNARLMNGDAVTIYGEFNTDAGKGIEGIIASDPDRVVKAYGVDGVLVKEDKACNVLDGLDKGVYIVDGVKVFVK